MRGFIIVSFLAGCSLNQDSTYGRACTNDIDCGRLSCVAGTCLRSSGEIVGEGEGEGEGELGEGEGEGEGEELCGDCDDADGCTTDTCVMGVCRHALIDPSCAPCARCANEVACSDVCVDGACYMPSDCLPAPCMEVCFAQGQCQQEQRNCAFGCANDSCNDCDDDNVAVCDDGDSCTEDSCVNFACLHTSCSAETSCIDGSCQP
jgi:hypothetical protein